MSAPTVSVVVDDVMLRFETFYRTRDVDLRNRLVEEHLGLADFHARRYRTVGAESDDVRQVARSAMIGAVDRFDPGRGVAFSTFAARTVNGECQRFLRDRTWGVRPPRRLQETFLAMRRAQEDLGHELGRAPTADEVAARIGADVEDVIEALEAGNARRSRALEPSSDRTDAPPVRAPLDIRSAQIHDEGTPYEAVDLRLTLRGVVERLPDRDREVIELRFVGGWTERQIAAHLGISQSYLSRRLRRILRDLRRMLDEDGDV